MNNNNTTDNFCQDLPISGNKADKSRLWAFEIYDESCPDDYHETLEDICDETGAKIAYIWHDRDVYSERDLRRAQKAGREVDWKPGDTKKIHAHVLIDFPNPRRPKSILELLRPLDVKKVIPVHNRLGMNRYLTHLDNPEKHQYRSDEIVTINGYQVVTEKHEDKLLRIWRELKEIIELHDITEAWELLMLASGNDEHEKFILNKAFFIDKVITWRRYWKESIHTDEIAEAELKRREEAKKQLIESASADSELTDYMPELEEMAADPNEDEQMLAEKLFMDFCIVHQVDSYPLLAQAIRSIRKENSRLHDAIQTFVLTMPEGYLSALIEKAQQL